MDALAYMSRILHLMGGAYLKVGLSALIFLASIGSISIPLVSSRFKNNNHWNSLANAFAGGVFLAIGLMHLLPEASENFKEVYGSSFPYSSLLAIASFTFVMYIEKVAFDSHQLMSHGDKHQDLGNHHHKDNSDEEEDRIKHELNMRNRFTHHLKVGTGDRKL
mmetsp:Transcript_5758/g.10278  ORF Transcript_5758/g.10278 Transcript_5758/m.10278 type:complete len:163 (-) Transcript_5758:556-1044(-)